jgi:selenocysteine lyase/cysteine desulfurase
VPDERRRFAALRADQFAGLDQRGEIYLDYTGSALYARCQIEEHSRFLQTHLVGNPHSENPAAALATAIIERARSELLRWFGAAPDDYAVVFTSNASAAVKLVGEAYPFRPGSRLTLLQDNHNSVNGLRRFAEARGARVEYLPLGGELRLAAEPRRLRPGAPPSLFAFPGQSNFSGVRHPLAIVERARGLGYDILLDAAALVPTCALDLSRVPADFVALSFYKMFGFPTGVGALIARRSALARLERPWFAGGTVDFVSVETRLHQLRGGPEGFEDGTPHFLGIAAVAPGLDFLRGVGLAAIGRHVERLTERLLRRLASLRHPSGDPMIRLYGPAGTGERGGSVAFNLLDREGRPVPYQLVERAAGAAGIHLRGGCFCNPGAAEAAFGFPAERTERCLRESGPGTFDVARLAECLGPGVAVGALRASLGAPSNEADVDRLADFLETCPATDPSPSRL